MLKSIKMATNRGMYRKYLFNEPASAKAIIENKSEIDANITTVMS